MLQKDGSVIFSEWNKGQAKHPIYGFGLLQNVEIFENKGIAKLKNRTVARSSIAPTQLPIAEVRDISGNTYTLTGSTGQGKVYKNGTVIQSGITNGWDLAIYKNYLWVRHSTVMSCYGPLDNAGAQWFGNVDTGFTEGYNGKLLVGQDDYLYSGNGNYVAKIEVTASGTVAVAPTLTSTKAGLDLKDGRYVATLWEQGKNIMVGTHGGSAYSDRGNHSQAEIFPWNRQAGTLGNPGLADLPVSLSENGVNAAVQHANVSYIQAGTQGNVYKTDGTNYTLIAKLPYARTGVTSDSTVFANAMSISSDGKLLIGLSGSGDGFSKAGVYEIDIADPNYPVSLRTISTGSVGTSSVLKIGFVRQTNYQTLTIGWGDGSTYSVDDTDFRMYSSYGGVIETPLVKVGSNDNQKTFERIEWSLADPLVNGQAIRISGRTNSKDDYELIGDWDYSVVGGVISLSDKALIANAEYVQLKVELDQDLTTLYGSNINLISIKLS